MPLNNRRNTIGILWEKLQAAVCLCDPPRRYRVYTLQYIMEPIVYSLEILCSSKRKLTNIPS